MSDQEMTWKEFPFVWSELNQFWRIKMIKIKPVSNLNKKKNLPSENT